MSINSVLRAMYGLQVALPDAAVQGASVYSEESSLRQRELERVQDLPQFFTECPELTQIDIEGVFDEARNGDGEMERTCFAAATFTFSVDVEGQCTSIETTTTDGPGIIDDTIDDLIDELCGDEDPCPLRATLEESRKSMIDIMSRYENRAKPGFEADSSFWDGGRRLAVARSTYERCVVDGLLDADALRTRLRLPRRPLVDRLDISDVAPPFWNAVNMQQVEERLNLGMDPHACDDNGVLPLVAAAAYGQRDTIELLISAGADVNAVDGNGFTAFTAAVATGNDGILSLLVDLGADPNGTRIVPSLLLAIGRNTGGKMMRSVVSAGADLDAVTPCGKPFSASFESYLDRANRDTREEVVQIVNSIKTEHEVFGALDRDVAPRIAQRTKSGPSL
jgi:hypothetical protein